MRCSVSNHYILSQYATDEEQQLDRQREAHFAYDCGDDCVYCNEQVCVWCGSTEFIRRGDVEKCACCLK